MKIIEQQYSINIYTDGTHEFYSHGGQVTATALLFIETVLNFLTEHYPPTSEELLKLVQAKYEASGNPTTGDAI